MAKSSITITLYMSELLYDIRNKSWLVGESRRTGDNHELVAAMQMNADAEHENQALRSISLAYGRLKTELNEYLAAETVTSDNDALISADSNLTLNLYVPGNYNHVTVKTVTAECTDYIENMTLSDWFQITSPTDAEGYAAKAAANLLNIRAAINKRVRPTRTNV